MTAQSVHALRIDIRRFLQTMDLIQQGKHRRVRNLLRGTLKLTGPIRDCDAIGEIAGELGLLDGLSGLDRKRVDAEAALDGFLHTHERELTLASTTPILISLERGGTRIKKLIARFWTLGDQAAKPGASFERLHRARLAAKGLRYALEACGGREDKAIAPLVKIQRILGRVNDLRTLLTALKSCEAGRRSRRVVNREIDSQAKAFSALWRGKHVRRRRRLSKAWLKLTAPGVPDYWIVMFAGLDGLPPAVTTPST